MSYSDKKSGKNKNHPTERRRPVSAQLENKVTMKMNRIKDVLNEQGRSQIWLAIQIGKSYVITTNYCNNKTQPRLTILQKMANALNVDITELLVGTKQGH
jgi:putative transcriptional regulator